MAKTFGLRMGGNELEIENLIKDYLINSNHKSFNYLEIGAAGCVTMRAIYDIVQENIKHDNWKIIGVDIDGGWSIDWNQIKSKFKIDEELELWMNRLSGLPLTIKKIPNAELWIDKNPRELIGNNFKDIDICFIDASHGYKSVQEDFLIVEKNIKPNGLIIAHDFCVLSQGIDYQEVDDDFINVRKALGDLGLMDNRFNNWKFEKEILGSRFYGGDGHGCGVFKKIC